MADSSSQSTSADQHTERTTSVLNPRASEFVPSFTAGTPKSAAADASEHLVQAQWPPARGRTSRSNAAKRSGTKVGWSLKAREGVRNSDELQAWYATSRRIHQQAVEGLVDFTAPLRSPPSPPPPPTTTRTTRTRTHTTAAQRRDERYEAQGARRERGGSRFANARQMRRNGCAVADGSRASASRLRNKVDNGNDDSGAPRIAGSKSGGSPVPMHSCVVVLLPLTAAWFF